MIKYEEFFTNLSDEEIHTLNRDIPNCAELESAINEWFLDFAKYDEPEIIQNIKKESSINNIFASMTLAIWYREGNHVQQSDDEYTKILESIISVKKHISTVKNY